MNVVRLFIPYSISSSMSETRLIGILSTVLFYGMIQKGHAWWPGFAYAMAPFFPPFPYNHGVPCGGSPCGQDPPRSPCPSCCQTPDPPEPCAITLTPTYAVVSVPCHYGLMGINSIHSNVTIRVLNDTCGPQNYRFETAVVHGPAETYVTYDSVTGQFYRSATAVVSQNMTQTISLKAYGLQNSVGSQTVYVTLKYDSCVFGLTGPDSARVCVGFPPNIPLADQIAAGSTEARNMWLYPQLTFVATNVPPMMPVLFDLPKNSSPKPGFGASDTANGGIFSPDVLSSVGGDGNVWISNYNFVYDRSRYDTIGIYGASSNGDIPSCSTGATVDPSPVAPGTGGGVTGGSCCQILRFSAMPGIADTPFRGGYKDVLVCYEDLSSCSYT